MKILVISDIHGNYHALDRVLQSVRYDALLCCGDIVVDYPFPEQCIKALKDTAAHVCFGNNDFNVAYGQKPSVQLAEKYAHLAKDLDRSTELTVASLSDDSINYLQKLPRDCRFTLDGISCCMNHTAPRMSVHDYLDHATPLSELADHYYDIQADVIFTGHTHIPYVKNIGEKVLVNPGSIGEPRDGDPRASYAIVDTATGGIELGRLEYDISETIEVLKELNYPGYSLYTLKNGFLPECPTPSEALMPTREEEK
jgi:putative phosphoesterase